MYFITLVNNKQIVCSFVLKPACSAAMILWLQFVQCDLQHDFALVADEADRSVVLALLQVAFLGERDD